MIAAAGRVFLLGVTMVCFGAYSSIPSLANNRQTMRRPLAIVHRIGVWG
jgi:hypothetical protein